MQVQSGALLEEGDGGVDAGNGAAAGGSRLAKRAVGVVGGKREVVGEMPDVRLSGHVEVIPSRVFDTKEHCKHTW